MTGRGVPKLVVFDLDYTLWPFYVDDDVRPPFKLNGKGIIVDYFRNKVKCYPQVIDILQFLHAKNIVIGIASKASDRDSAEALIKLFEWDKFITYKEIHPGCKVTHFKQLKEQSSINFEDMIFFDDEHGNIKDVKKLGVTAIYVSDGMDMLTLQKGLDEHAVKFR